MKFHLLILSLLCCALSGSAAQTIPFIVYLEGGQVVPPNAITLGGTGLVTLTADSLVVDLHIEETYRNRPVHTKPGTDPSAPVNQRQWHVTINGPALPDANAPVLFDLGICGASGAGFTTASSGTGVISKPVNGPRPPRPPPTVPVVSVCELDDVVTLTRAQQQALFDGLLYVEAEGFGGRIRGRILLADSDGDSVPDYLDECPDTAAGSLVNNDGCSLEQLAPCDGLWKNHGQFEKAFKDATKSLVEAGAITHQAKKELDKEAEHSDCGKNR